MALVGTASPYRSNSYTNPSSSAMVQDDLDEDLLSMMSSDTFSLESRRDKDLQLLSAFLQTVLPQQDPNEYESSNDESGAQWMAGTGQSRGGSNQFNGWRPTPDSSFGGSFGLPVPSTSAASAPSSSYHPSPFHIPASPLPLSNSPETTRRFARASSSAASGFPASPGPRVPAASRERPTWDRVRQSSGLSVNVSSGDWDENADEEMECEGSAAAAVQSQASETVRAQNHGWEWMTLNSQETGVFGASTARPHFA